MMQTTSETNDSPRSASGAEEGKYAYCIIPSAEKRDFGNIGIGGEKPVYTVHY